MLDKILVPLDGSSLAECVLPHLVAVAQAAEAEVTLLHVVGQDSNVDPGYSVDVLNWHLRKAEAQAYLEGVSERLQEFGLVTDNVLLEGPAAERVIEYAHEHDVDLILLSSHGRSGLSGWNVSSVVQKIILRAYTTVMIIPAYNALDLPLGDLHYRRIMAPLDGSQRAGYVLPMLTTLAQHHAADILLVHVVQKPEMPRRAPLNPRELALVEEIVNLNYDEASNYLAQLKARLPGNVETRLMIGDSAINSLHDLVEKESVDLVVLSAHGYSCGSKRLYGSVGISFIAYGTAPLLIIQDLPPDEMEPTKAEALFHHSGNGHGGRMLLYDKPPL